MGLKVETHQRWLEYRELIRHKVYQRIYKSNNGLVEKQWSSEDYLWSEITSHKTKEDSSLEWSTSKKFRTEY